MPKPGDIVSSPHIRFWLLWF